MLRKLFILILLSSITYGQECSSTFWTIDTNSGNGGNIRQWNLSSGIITGGSVIMSALGIGANGLAYCGTGNDVTFYCTTYENEIKKYDPALGWVTVLNPIAPINNGGYGNHQYFTDGGNIFYYDGTNVTQIATMLTITVADIAVDSQGRAWIFTGTLLSGGFIETTALRVYDSTGLIATYPLMLNTNSAYGSFFLNDNLYILKKAGLNVTDPNSLTPVIITGTVAQPGTPIPFDCVFCHDAASCNTNTNQLGSAAANFSDELAIFPNPTNDVAYISPNENIQNVSIFSVDGKLIKSSNDHSVNLTNCAKGIYVIKVTSFDNRTVTKLIEKR
jgi:hypothetical protein